MAIGVHMGEYKMLQYIKEFSYVQLNNYLLLK